MADDIVTRLCELAGDWDYIGLMPKDDLREAAAEIERLRAAGDELAERLRWWTDVAREAAAAVVLQTWEEARRG